MLNTESGRFVTDPQLNEKSDSTFFAFGIMQAMQQLADQYFFQNEMRGDLVTTTAVATTDLKNLSNFSAGTENKYDSVYLYYKVINNCNYYLEKRDTTLKTGNTNVVVNEYVGVAAFRAWTYLQLTNQYGDVPYVTSPVINKTDINSVTGKTNYREILQKEANNLQTLKDKFAPYQLTSPTYTYWDGTAKAYLPYYTYGNMNYSTDEKMGVNMELCFIPLNVVLGDLYLELGNYEQAVKCYYDFLYTEANRTETVTENGKDVEKSLNYHSLRLGSFVEPERTIYPFTFPIDAGTIFVNTGWSEQFVYGKQYGLSRANGIVSYIPMSANYTTGVTTEVPNAFGYDYYSTKKVSYSERGRAFDRMVNCPEMTDIMVVPSQEYLDSAFKAPYYYKSTSDDPRSSSEKLIKSYPAGDGRSSVLLAGNNTYKDNIYVQKPGTGYIYLYRTASIYLRIAEAFNRMGYPELAFAIMKVGLQSDGLADIRESKYSEAEKLEPFYFFLPDSQYDMLTTGNYPFCNVEGKTLFTPSSVKGIHELAAGGTSVSSKRSPYTYNLVVEDRIKYIRQTFGVGSGDNNFSREEYINAVEDLICDEYAMEFAFEGRRFSDLLRMARHKNMDSAYGAGFGDRWLSKKLEHKAAGITTQNCYLPFQ